MSLLLILQLKKPETGGTCPGSLPQSHTLHLSHSYLCLILPHPRPTAVPMLVAELVSPSFFQSLSPPHLEVGVLITLLP